MVICFINPPTKLKLEGREAEAGTSTDWLKTMRKAGKTWGNFSTLYLKQNKYNVNKLTPDFLAKDAGLSKNNFKTIKKY